MHPPPLPFPWVGIGSFEHLRFWGAYRVPDSITKLSIGSTGPSVGLIPRVLECVSSVPDSSPKCESYWDTDASP